MYLRCQTLDGRLVNYVPFERRMKVNDLKRAVAGRFGAEFDRVRLFFNHQYLDADYNLAKRFNIKDRDVIEVVFLPKDTKIVEVLQEVNHLNLDPYPSIGEILNLDHTFLKTKIIAHDTVQNFNGPYAIVWSSNYATNDDKMNTILFTGVTQERWTEFNQSLASKCDARIFNKVAFAKDWTSGLDVKVFKKLTHQIHQNQRFRYEGNYKVVAHWTATHNKKEQCFLLSASDTPLYVRKKLIDENIGPIKGIKVGDIWSSRTELSQLKIHPPRMHGIYGKTNEYAYSIILSGKYEDGIDDGDIILYTGSGGRQASSGKQISDQKLTKGNRQLALSCNAALDEKYGAVARNWSDGVSLRVFRKIGERLKDKRVRYDGQYKVFAYWPHTGNAGFLVWNFLLIRDEPGKS